MIAPVKRLRWLRANGSGLSRFDMFEIEHETTPLFAPPAQPFPVSSFDASVSVRCAPVASRLERRAPPDAEPSNPVLPCRERAGRSRS